MNTVSIVGSAKSSRGDQKPHSPLIEFLEAEGFRATSDSRTDLLIAVNHNERQYRAFIRAGGNHYRAALIRLEPDSVYPLQYKRVTTEKYGLVATPGSVRDRKASDFFVGWPYRFNRNPASPNVSDPSLLSILGGNTWEDLFDFEMWHARPKELTMIAANKVSPLTSANYSIRRRLAAELPVWALEVYGPLWADNVTTKIRHRLAVGVTNCRQGTFPSPTGLYGSLFRSYPTARGSVPDKHAILRETKFSLVVENSNSYVSEKLLDAMINGSIPIYVGPKLEEVGLPSEIAIQATGDPAEIIEILNAVDSISVKKTLFAMREFFRSPTFFDYWSEQSVYKKLSYQIAEHFRGLPE